MAFAFSDPTWHYIINGRKWQDLQLNQADTFRHQFRFSAHAAGKYGKSMLQ
jgi:hypothetical protein